jgi:choline transport protein
VSAAEVFGKFENWGGWPTMGAAVVLGQLASSSAFAGVDSAAHMAEEVCIFLYVHGVPVLTLS